MRYLLTLFLLLLTLGFAEEKQVLAVDYERNEFVACENSLEMFAWDLDFIRQARHSIDISACFTGGKIFQELLSTLEKQIQEYPDLQVYILTTPVFHDKQDQAQIRRMEKWYPNNFHLVHASSVMVVSPDLAGIDNHVKMLVVDETYFSMGGTNLEDVQCADGSFTPPRNPDRDFLISGGPLAMRDQDVVGRGPLAQDLRKIFHQLYSLWEDYNKTQSLIIDPELFAGKNHYRSVSHCERPFVERFEMCARKVPLSEGKFKLIFGGPWQKPNLITCEYEKLINEAKEEIVIGNLYFSPIDSTLKCLMGAVNRGVELKVITNGISDVAPSYTKLFCWANRMTYVPVFYGKTYRFWSAGKAAKDPVKNTSIYEYNVKDIAYHKKIMIVDQRFFVIGSYNIGTKSDCGDYELVIVLDSPELAEAALKVWETDRSLSVEVSPKQARSWYFNPVTAYLGQVQKKFHGLL